MTTLKIGAAAAVLAIAAPALAETQTEKIVAEQRTSVSLRIAPEIAQSLLPAGWQPSASADGPNLTLIFMDRALQLTPDGKPLQSGSNHLLVLAVGARNSATGETRSMIVGGYSDDPQGVPGAYKVYKPGQVTVTRNERHLEVQGKPQTTVSEHWEAKGADGATVNLDLSWRRGLPELRTFEQKNYSGAEPAFYRIYRGKQAVDTVRTDGVNRAGAIISLKASGGVLGKAIDGSQRIVSVSTVPFYSRLTFLP